MKKLFIKPFKQRPSFCGPATLKMILSFYGMRISEKRAAQATGTRPYHGTPGRAIVEGAKKLGFDAFMKDYSTWNDLSYWINKKKTPVIVNWFSENVGHYSVAIGIDKNHIILSDPEDATEKKFSQHIFHRVWFDFAGVPYPTKPDDIVIRRMIVVTPHTIKK
jgi:ABC-type bacteriocin/lantibiotic exporter with double-glycine peptidase domain